MEVVDLIELVKIESKAQEERFSLSSGVSLKQLRAEGVVIYPLRVNRKSYGYADYPEFSFHLPFPTETSNFKNGSSIHLFSGEEQPISGVLLFLEGAKGEVRLYTSDFPDWLEDKNVGLQLISDQRTTEIQLEALKRVQETKSLARLYEQFHQKQSEKTASDLESRIGNFQNEQLNDSQKHAIESCLSNNPVEIIHGPPGTGKTTTLVELISQLFKQGKKICVTAPSNTAVDNLGTRLIAQNIPFLRVGNNVKVSETIFPFTIEGKMEESQLKQDIKKMRIQSDQLRKMAHQYKRNFGKAEREQRNLLLQEVKNIRKEIRAMQQHFESTLFEKNSIILGTPIGIYDAGFKDESFDVLVVDEAGQCLEPLIWVVVPLAKRMVLAGDPFQLPPTVISNEAQRKGFAVSLLERLVKNDFPTHLLDVQYRMQSVIAEFSNRYFYEGKLKTFTAHSDAQHLHFYDSAGADFSELEDEESSSLYNLEELNFIRRLVEQEQLNAEDTVFITPYNGQLQKAKEVLSDLPFARFSTIDSFQGQEAKNVIISLVRSNSDQKIGFLADYRRMNVAMTRAQNQLYIIGDSATIGNDDFYSQMLGYFEEINGYHSVYEVM